MKPLILSLVLLSAPVLAQDVTAPTLAPDAAMRIQVFELTAENLSLKIAILQAEAQKNQQAAAAYIATLAKDGYQLTRGEQGWRYVKAQP